MHKPYFLLCAFLVLVLVSSVGCTDSRPVNQIIGDSIEWSPFVWTAQEDLVPSLGEKQAMLVPISLDGDDRVYYLQHDTGVWNSQLYENPYRELKFSHRVIKRKLFRPAVVSFNAKIGDMETQNNRFVIRPNFGSSLRPQGAKPIIGTIGLDYFAGRVLVIDFVRERFAVTPSVNSLPPEIVEHIHWHPAHMRSSKFTVQAMVNGTPVSLLYDTGASSSDVGIFKAGLWSQLTGKKGDEADITRLEGPSWGQTVHAMGFPSPGYMSLGNLSFEAPQLWHIPALENINWPTDGLLGNSLFYDKYILIMDLSNTGIRLGLVESAKLRR